MKMNRQVTDLEKILTKQILDKGLVSRIYRNPLQLNDKRSNQYDEMGKRFKETIHKGSYTNGK